MATSKVAAVDEGRGFFPSRRGFFWELTI